MSEETESTDEADAPLTLAELKKRRPAFQDVPTSIGVFRLHRLSLPDVIEMSSTIGELTDEDGNLEQEDMHTALGLFVAKSLGGEFDTEEGRKEVSELPPGDLTVLIQELSDLVGMGLRKREVAEAKND